MSRMVALSTIPSTVSRWHPGAEREEAAAEHARGAPGILAAPGLQPRLARLSPEAGEARRHRRRVGRAAQADGPGPERPEPDRAGAGLDPRRHLQAGRAPGPEGTDRDRR